MEHEHKKKSSDIVVIGAGAAGMMAAIWALREGAQVTLLERNPKPGRKLYITGKGRCNVTNHCSPEEVLANVPHNSRFLFGSVKAFSPEMVMEFFERLGVPLKTERGNRVFPQSDHAADIIDALVKELNRNHVLWRHGRAIHLLQEEGHVTGVQTEEEILSCKAVLLCTGGLSYPLTGSTGDGLDMARAAGHTILSPRPSLVPLESQDSCCKKMQGLSLKNVELKVKNQAKKIIFQEQGELLFAHFGLSGPLVLSASAHMRSFDTDTYTAWIDLKPALDETTLDARILRDLSANQNREMQNVLGGLLPRKMIPVMLHYTGISGDTKANSLTKQQRRRLVEGMKAFPVAIEGPRPIEEAIVTSGGVKVSEIDPKTMASKRVRGLYFAGELIDVDAYTGGFNLQIAWSTGRAAGLHAAEFCRE